MIILIGLTTFSSCQSPNDANKFGQYYSIGDFGMSAPFAESPNISTPIDNEQLKYIEYRYAYPKTGDDINYMYAVAVYQLKNNAYLTEEKQKVNFISTMNKVSIETVFKGQTLMDDSIQFNNRYCIRQKTKMLQPGINEEIIINSMYFLHKNNIIRLYVWTPLKSPDNNRIEEFFNSIKLE